MCWLITDEDSNSWSLFSCNYPKTNYFRHRGST